MNEYTPKTETDMILERLQPRMRAARVGHVRRLIGGVALVPLLAVGAAAMASSDGDPVETETAHSAPEAVAPDIELPDIGDAGGDEAGINEGSDTNEDDEADAPATVAAPAMTAAPDDVVYTVDLGEFGSAQVEETDDGGFAVLSYGLTEGWEVVSAEFDGEHLVVVIANGDLKKEITIKPGLRDELSVIVEEIIPPTTTTEKPPPPPTTEKPHVIVDRFVVEVPGKGSFVVEREGDTLWAGNVTVNEGYEYDIIKAEGWKVYVGFTNGEHIWYGKALINDRGDVEIHHWDEPDVPDPVYQWVEIGGVGAAKFKLHDGQIWVKELAPAEGFGAWDYNQGAPGVTAKVDFEGEGVIWFIDVWINGDGNMEWTKYQGE